MNNKLLYWTTWFAIWLVLTLPVVAAQQLLTVQKFAGKDNVQGFAKENDELTIQILAQMIGNPPPEIARQRARVYVDDTYTFMNSCTPQAASMYQCTYTTRDIVYGGTDDYKIKLYDAEDKEIASADRMLTVDFHAPRVVSLSVSPNLSTSPVPTTVRYKVEDYGTETGKATNCAGIKLVNITTGTSPIGVAAGNVGECVKEGTITFTPTVTEPSTRLSVCAVVTDHLNHKSAPVCKTLLIDSVKPTATEVVLRDKDGFVITSMRSGQAVTADVFVSIPDADINAATVKADLSKLNPSLGKIVRTDQSGNWFIWRDVAITTPATCEVTVEANDLTGNKDTKTLSCTISIDDTGPQPVKFNTPFVDEDETLLIGVNGTISVEFKETGTGLHKRNAFLDLRAFGLGTEVKADACEKTSAEAWTCSWRVRPTAGNGTYTAKLLPISRDDLNNQVPAGLEARIRFDNTLPANLRIKEIAAFRGDQRVLTNVTSLGETMEFVIEGSGFTTALADFTTLGGENATLAEKCEGNFTKTCTFAMTTSVSGPQNTTILFDVRDAAGNTARINTSKLFILGITNETNPNYWKVMSECSPTVLDRATLSVFEHPVYCRMKLTSTNALAQPITVQGPLDATECSGQTEYVSDLRVENNYGGSKEPYLAISLVATDYTINNLNVTCPISTLTRVGSFRPQNPETDNVTITLQFTNLPLGELYGNIKDEVMDVEKRIDGVWKLVGQLQKFITYAEKLCQILNMFMAIVSTIGAVVFGLGLVSVSTIEIPFVGIAISQAADESARPLCFSSESLNLSYPFLFTALKSFCDFLACQYSLFDALNLIPGVNIDIGYPSETMNFIFGTGAIEKIGAEPEVVQNPAVYFNSKDSLIASIIIPPFCIPGIIYNLDKWRQIQCRYGTCLLEDVKEQGLPISACKDQKSYMQCRFVVGEIFNLIPFASLVNHLLTSLQNILSNPLVAAAFVIEIACMAACASPKFVGIVHNACSGYRVISRLSQTVKYIIDAVKAKDQFLAFDTGWCENFEDALEEFEQ